MKQTLAVLHVCCAFLVLLAVIAGAGGSAYAASNPIVIENALPGNPKSEWDVSGSGDPSIQGFTTDISYNRGQTVQFKVDTKAKAYLLDIYRMGYYGGMGARKVATLNGQVIQQPNCNVDAATGLVDCGNWSVTASWPIPSTATSGIYFAKLVRTDTGGASHVFFVVRDDSSHSNLLVQTSDTTWQAYNEYGGNSLYVGQPVGRAYKVSYNRPLVWRSGSAYSGVSNVFNDEYPMVRWLEANGYDISYFSGVDSDRFGNLIQNHKVFLSVGHDEYWSSTQRANVEAALARAGVNLAFFSGNEVFWKTRWENSIYGPNPAYRTLPVCYKETHANEPVDPLDPPMWTGTWRDPRFSPPADGGAPENALTGTIFTVNGIQFNNLTVSGDYGRMRFWRNTDLATLPLLSPPATLGTSVLGYEWDEDLDNGFRPRGLIRLSSTTADVNGRILDYGSSYGPGPATHHLTLYRHSSGALVFGAGTLQWSWGLDANHDNNAGAPVSGPDVRIQQATVNLFADMGVQPASLRPGLVAANASTDTQAPTSQITSPPSGATVERGSAVTIAGTAVDSGGVVGGVEVSVDGGTSWHPATGREDWNYTWVPTVVGSATIRSAAVDDSGNLESPGAAITVNVAPSSGPARIWSDAVIPATTSANDPNPVELGVKFISDVSGSITGIHFYKGNGNTEPHFGHLWLGDGTLLATATFENETASGWQQANFPSPVPINANTTYVASYHTDVGHYAFNSGYFSASGVDSPPLHALRDGIDGPNGVYAYGGSGFPLFPSSTFQSANYWIDVDFAPSSPLPDHTTVWADTVVPNLISADDASAVELGVKFRTDVDGSITSLRFYKGSANTGTHVGHLWASNGSLIATATFTNETVSGWQQVDFPSPVPILANTTYVASYHTDVGRYSANVGYFANSGVDSPPLYALQNGTDGPNGVYRYGPSAFPTQTYQSTNYWVDVVFQQNAPSAAISSQQIAPSAAVSSAQPKKDAKPRKPSKIKYPLSAWREKSNESWNPLKPGARGPLNGGNPISPQGK